MIRKKGQKRKRVPRKADGRYTRPREKGLSFFFYYFIFFFFSFSFLSSFLRGRTSRGRQNKVSRRDSPSNLPSRASIRGHKTKLNGFRPTYVNRHSTTTNRRCTTTNRRCTATKRGCKPIGWRLRLPPKHISKSILKRAHRQDLEHAVVPSFLFQLHFSFVRRIDDLFIRNPRTGRADRHTFSQRDAGTHQKMIGIRNSISERSQATLIIWRGDP